MVGMMKFLALSLYLVAIIILTLIPSPAIVAYFRKVNFQGFNFYETLCHQTFINFTLYETLSHLYS